jgi:hypothetical protein
MLTAKTILEEYKKCYQDKSRIYMIENFLETFDATQNNTVPFKLFPRQKELVRNLSDGINNITTKPRQAGVSTVVCAFFSCEMALADSKKPETILLIANNLDLSKENLAKIKEFLTQIPRWFWGNEYFGSSEKEERTIFTKANEKYLILNNGSKAYARSAGPNSSRGVSSCTRLLFDESAFIETPETITSAISTTASSAKSVIYVSTPNGYDKIYYPVYVQALKGENDFRLSKFGWYQDPRYNRNLSWTLFDKKTGEISTVKELTIDAAGNIEYDEAHWEDMINKGYTPSSPWYDGMCNRYNHDKQKIAQELDVSFVGSAGTVVDSDIIEFHKHKNAREPIYTDKFFKEAWIFKEPIEGHRYLMPCDVSTGSGEDSSVIHAIDIDAVDEKGMPCIEQVFEYQGKVQGDILGELIDKYGRYYGNALVIVDCVGSSGDAAVLKLQSLQYPNLYFDDQSLKNVTVERSFNSKTENNNTPGFRLSSVRLQMIMNLEKTLRFNEVRIRSKRFISELETWIWKNGRPDHQSGFHDDTLTSMAMGLYVLQFSFKKLEAVKEKNKAILNSMILAQTAINGGGLLEASEKVKSIPLPFYMSGMRPNVTIKPKDSDIPKTNEQIHREILDDRNKILNRYLIDQMNKYIR